MKLALLYIQNSRISGDKAMIFVFLGLKKKIRRKMEIKDTEETQNRKHPNFDSTMPKTQKNSQNEVTQEENQQSRNGEGLWFKVP